MTIGIGDDMSLSIDWEALMQESVYKKPKLSATSYASNNMKTVLSITAGGQSIEKMPSEMFVATVEKLDLGLPIQIQLEVVPTAPMGFSINSEDELCGDQVDYLYLAKIVSVKARVKPSTMAFIAKEAKQQDQLGGNSGHIINGTEDSVQDAQREIKFMQQQKKAEQEPNRFTGLEIGNEEEL